MTDNLENRVAELEQEVEQINDQLAVTDDSGREWTPQDLMSMGLSRRQALGALGALAITGGSIMGAIRWATQNARAADTSGGTIGDSTVTNGELDIVLDEIIDSGGDVVADVDDTGAIDFHSRGLTNLSSLSTEEADITNETFARLTRGSDTSSTTSGSWINGFDGESKDVRGEVNSSAQFNPDKTGEYKITVLPAISGSTSAGDEIRCRVRNITDNSIVKLSRKESPSSFADMTYSFTANLNSSKSYEIQFTNQNSSFTVTTAAEAEIYRVIQG